MKQQVASSKVREPRKWRFRGIGDDAKALGVTKEHLRLVLNGRRFSRSLLRRWVDLQKTKLPQAEQAAYPAAAESK